MIQPTIIFYARLDFDLSSKKHQSMLLQGRGEIIRLWTK